MQRQLNLGHHWVIYNGEDTTNPLLSVKRHVTMGQKKSLAEVAPLFPLSSSSSFVAEGSYAQRCCTFQNKEGQQVAEIRRKEVATSNGGVNFGDDVFQLVVQPEMSTCLAMGIVIALDQMVASRPYLIWSWSSWDGVQVQNFERVCSAWQYEEDINGIENTSCLYFKERRSIKHVPAMEAVKHL